MNRPGGDSPWNRRDEPALFPQWVAVLLENADREIKFNVKGPYETYSFIRATMSKICRVDAFYIGFFRPGARVFFPYTYDSGRYENPALLRYSTEGVSAWILRTGETYKYKQDNGLLLKRGQRFGKVERETWDAIVVPLLDDEANSRPVIGVLSIQSYEPNTYDEVAVRALEWLARSVAVSLRRSEEDRLTRSSLGIEDSDVRTDPLTRLAEQFGHQLHRLQEQIGCLLIEAEAGKPANAGALHALVELCERIPTELSDFALRPTETSRMWASLTAQQKRVARLIAKGYTNKEIAEELVIAESTTKKHVTAILAAFKVKQRVGVIQILQGIDL